MLDWGIGLGLVSPRGTPLAYIILNYRLYKPRRACRRIINVIDKIIRWYRLCFINYIMICCVCFIVSNILVYFVIASFLCTNVFLQWAEPVSYGKLWTKMTNSFKLYEHSIWPSFKRWMTRLTSYRNVLSCFKIDYYKDTVPVCTCRSEY